MKCGALRSAAGPRTSPASASTLAAVRRSVYAGAKCFSRMTPGIHDGRAGIGDTVGPIPRRVLAIADGRAGVEGHGRLSTLDQAE
jgi:hypothetical protein